MNKLETQKSKRKEKKKNEEEIGQLLEKEFRIMIVMMIKNLENKIEKMQESNNKDLGELKKTYIQRQTIQLLKLKIL